MIAQNVATRVRCFMEQALCARPNNRCFVLFRPDVAEPTLVSISDANLREQRDMNKEDLLFFGTLHETFSNTLKRYAYVYLPTLGQERRSAARLAALTYDLIEFESSVTIQTQKYFALMVSGTNFEAGCCEDLDTFLEVMVKSIETVRQCLVSSSDFSRMCHVYTVPITGMGTVH